MRKLIYFLMFILIVAAVAFYFTHRKEIVQRLDDNKIYEIKNEEIINIKTLDECKFYNKGILTYNNQKIIYLDYSNNVIWEKESRVFTDKIFVDDGYIFRCLDNSVELIFNDNKSYIIPEIKGNILNVSREKNKIHIITEQKDGQNSLYILNENNEVIVENKYFNDKLTSVSSSDKSEGYTTTVINYKDGKLINTLTYHLMGDIELWSNTVEDEAIMKTKIVNNNILVIGTGNIYFFNFNGKLFWKNSNYSKIKWYEVIEKDEEIYILYEKGEKLELICYNFEGKVKNIYKIQKNVKKFKVYNKKIFTYSENIINLLHGNKIDKLYENNNEQIIDFYVENNNIFILFKNKLIIGQIS